MKKIMNVFCLILLLSLLITSISLGDEASDILKKAFDMTLSRSYSMTEHIGMGKQSVITSVKQRINHDGTVFRLTETLDSPYEKKSFYIDRKIINNHSGQIDLYISKYGVYGIRRTDIMLRSTIDRNSIITAKKIIHDGKASWLVRETLETKFCNEYIIDMNSFFIWARKTYNPQGKLLLSSRCTNVDFNPTLHDNLFQIPEGAKINNATNAQDALKMDIDIIKRHSEYVARERRAKGLRPKASQSSPITRAVHKITKGDIVGFLLAKMPFVFLVIATLSGGCAVFVKIRKQK